MNGMPAPRSFRLGTGALVAVLGLGWLSLNPVRADNHSLPPGEREKVLEAVKRGVEYLKRTQGDLGTWADLSKASAGQVGKGLGPVTFPHDWPIGYAAMPGLALLEGGTPANDPHVQKAAEFVRSAVKGQIQGLKVEKTYEIALAIMFLDQLGKREDSKLIRELAVRLMGGQSATGGWGYICPPMSQGEYVAVLNQARKFRPALPPHDFRGGLHFAHLKQGYCIRQTESPADVPPPPPSLPPRKPQVNTALAGLPLFTDLSTLKMADPGDRPYSHPFEPNFRGITTDNSNTQFAMLALWAARRHDVPVERCLKLIEKRFITSQNSNGTWSYYYRNGGDDSGSIPLTCAGLLGMAISFGNAKESGIVVGRTEEGEPITLSKKRVMDAFVALSPHVGRPGGSPGLGTPNLYFLWSLERVAVLYNLDTIGTKQWFRWVAGVLLACQKADGGWSGGAYAGSSPVIDTSLALLILNRANLAEDLAAKLPFTQDELGKELRTRIPADQGVVEDKVAAKPADAASPDSPAAPSPPPKAVATPPKETTPAEVTKPEPARETSPSPAESPPPAPKTEATTPPAAPDKKPEEEAAAPSSHRGLYFLGGFLVILAIGGVMTVRILRNAGEDEDEEPAPGKKRRPGPAGDFNDGRRARRPGKKSE